MNKKLTLSMDEAVIEAAKEYAQKKGRSLSSILENMLRVTTGLKQEEEYYRRKPYMKEYINFLEEKHGPIQ